LVPFCHRSLISQKRTDHTHHKNNTPIKTTHVVSFMQLIAHAPRRAARIPRRQSQAPSLEMESLIEVVPRSSLDEIFAPPQAAPSLAPMFPVLYHAVGECLAHPHRPCKCVKTSRMAQSQADAWKELGSRFKEHKRFERTVSAPLEHTVFSLRDSVMQRACSSPGPASSCPPTPQHVSGVSTPTAASMSTATGCPRPARRRSCVEVHGRNAVPDPPALTRLSSTRQKSCPVSSLAAAVFHPVVRRTASTGTPGAAFRPSPAQVVPQATLFLRQQTVRIRMLELEHARAHRMSIQEEATKPAGSRRVQNRAVDATG